MSLAVCKFLTRLSRRGHLFGIGAGAMGRLQEDNHGDFAIWVLCSVVGSVELENRNSGRQTFGLFLLVVIFLWLMWWKENTYFR